MGTFDNWDNFVDIVNDTYSKINENPFSNLLLDKKNINVKKFLELLGMSKEEVR